MVHKKGIFKDICSKSFEIDLTNDQPDKFDEIGRLMKLKWVYIYCRCHTIKSMSILANQVNASA